VCVGGGGGGSPRTLALMREVKSMDGGQRNNPRDQNRTAATGSSLRKPKKTKHAINLVQRTTANVERDGERGDVLQPARPLYMYSPFSPPGPRLQEGGREKARDGRERWRDKWVGETPIYYPATALSLPPVRTSRQLCSALHGTAGSPTGTLVLRITDLAWLSHTLSTTTSNRLGCDNPEISGSSLDLWRRTERAAERGAGWDEGELHPHTLPSAHTILA
jgi:hypothetical protein